MWANATCDAATSQCGGYEPEQVLVAYVLSEFSGFLQRDVPNRIRIRTIFELCARQQITTVQLNDVTQALWPELVPASNQLIQLIQDPITGTRMSTEWFWSSEETLKLLYGLCNSCAFSLGFLLPHRSESQCRTRITRVVRALTSKGALTDEFCPPPLSYVKHQPITIQQCKLRSNEARRLQATLMRLKTQSKQKILQLRGKIMALQKKLKILEEQICKFEIAAEGEISDNPDDDPPQEVSTRLQDAILSELVLWSHQSERTRRYSTKLQDLCQLLHLTSPKTYRILRQFLPIPSQSCLRYHYADALKNTMYWLTAEEALCQHIDALFEGSPQESLFTIAIDAFAFRTFTEKSPFKSDKVSTFNNGFLFMHIPLDANLPCKILHLQKKQNGAFDSSVMAIFNRIHEHYRRSKMKIMFRATDGDRFLTSDHEQFFQKHVSEYRGDFSLLVGRVYEMLFGSDVVMPIADPLHFAKNFRAKLLLHDVAVTNSTDSEMVFINAEHLQKFLHLGQSLSDATPIGKMRDKYVTDLFSLHNVWTLLDSKQYHSAFALLPYACIFTVLYATNITCETRQFLVNLAYNGFERLLTEAENIVRDHCCIKHRYGAGVMAVTVAEPGYIKRMMHTCIALGISIIFGPKYLRLDSIGTHLLENSIGIGRSVSNSTEYSRIVWAFANCEMRKKLAGDYGLSLYVSRRVNDGGAKIDTSSAVGLSHPGWDARDVISLLHEACITSIRDSSKTERDSFCKQLHEFASQLCIHQLSTPSAVANSLIIERNFKYQKCSQE